MFDLRKLFVRETPGHRPDPDSDYHPSDKSGDSLEGEYQSLIATQFRRWGISPSCVTIEVRKLGRAPDGFDVLVGMVRIGHWDRDSVLRLLLGLPVLESKVRKTVRATWLADFSHFAGLWLHASEQLHAHGDSAELRELLMQLVPPPGPGQSPASEPGVGSSSLPPSTGGLNTGRGASEPGEESPVAG